MQIFDHRISGEPFRVNPMTNSKLLKINTYNGIQLPTCKYHIIMIQIKTPYIKMSRQERIDNLYSVLGCFSCCIIAHFSYKLLLTTYLGNLFCSGVFPITT